MTLIRDIFPRRFSWMRLTGLGLLMAVLVGGASLSRGDTPAPEAIASSADPPVEAAVLLRLGADFTRDGRLTEAAAMYRELLRHGAAYGTDDRAAALFNLGNALLSDGLAQAAIDAFGQLLAAYPAHADAPQAYFLRARAYLSTAQWNLALADLRQYMALRPGIIDSYAHELIAEAQLATGQVDAALESYESAIAARRAKVPLLILRETAAGHYRSRARNNDALRQYDAILDVAVNYGYRAGIAFEAARTLIDGGQLESGLERMMAIVEAYPQAGEAYQALEILESAGWQIDALRRAAINYAAGDYAAAVAAFDEVTLELGAESLLMLGRAQRIIGDAGAALHSFEAIVARFPQSPQFGDALLERGRTRFLAGDNPAAIEIYLAIANEHPQLPAAGEALWRAAYLHGALGELDESRRVFIRLAETYPDHSLAVDGLRIAADADLAREQWATAEDLFRRISALSHGAAKADAELWNGKLATLRNDRDAANAAFEATIASAPDSFHAARASDLRSGRQPFAAADAFRFSFDVGSDVAQAEAWLRQVFAIDQGGDLWRLSADLSGDSRLVRGRELYALGLGAEASDEFEDLLDALRKNGDVLGSYQMAVHLRGLGAYRESIIAAADVIIASGRGTLNAPAFIARLRFPDYYINLVSQEAEARAVDPLLMLSLIRLESLFDTSATAAAGEKGLMQVIPSTAQYIADKLAWPDYQHSDLFKPYAGIAFGAFYLDEQLGLFGQWAVAALAAYNAGPGRAWEWSQIAGDDPDRFMDAISIDSTRHYVQFIYRNYNIYRELYGIES